ncbi:MAG: alpha-L-fucosidase [Bacteroidaceae bacterium]|nr:alpha-L-fucosidase [Bacteroidaceae bacterium]
MKKVCLSIGALLMMTSSAWAQNYTIPVLENDEKMATGQFTPDWESLRTYEVPEWFRDAKFGIWAHWGPQCVEGSGDWMARELYMEGNHKYDYHREHYGHPSEVGFKDILPLFKAENWNPEELVQFYKECGAQYFFALGNHHDNFDLWDSKYQEWNSKDIGPHKDILDGWSKAAHKAGLPFGISFHADHAWIWYEPSRRFDLKGNKRGVKYDGWLTKEDGYKPNPDGTEKWWKGLDPQKLYQQDHDFSRNTWDNGSIHSQWGWDNGANLPTQEFVTNFYNRTLDAINRYQPDLIYFDVTVLPFYPVSDCGMRITTHMYNHHNDVTSKKSDIKTPATAKQNPGVVFGKILEENQKSALVWDVERGAPNKIMDYPWQCCNCIGGWHYDTGIYRNNSYKSAATVAKLLVDIVSKNGNMLLSVPLRADGTPDEKELAIMKEFGAWMNINKEGIVATRPWKIFGEGPIADADVKINAQGFNDGNYTKAGSGEIRFTQSKDGRILYAAGLAWPKDHKMTVKSLKEGSPLYPGKIKSVKLLGYGKVKFTRTNEALVINLPEENLNRIMPVVKIEGGL